VIFQRQKTTGGAGLVLIAFALVSALTFSGAHAGARGTQHATYAVAAPHGRADFAFADFDGDARPDFAVVQTGVDSSRGTFYRIAFRLSSGPRRSFGITAPPGGLAIEPLDVNADGFPDVIVRTAWTNRPVAILLNDGKGNFELSEPSAFYLAFPASHLRWTRRDAELGDASALVQSNDRSSGSLQPFGNLFARNAAGFAFHQSCASPHPHRFFSFSTRAPPPSAQSI
jgi:hypothetical protein